MLSALFVAEKCAEPTKLIDLVEDDPPVEFALVCGRVTRDPETKFLPSGKRITSTSLAVNWGGGKSGKEQVTEYVKIVAFDEKAELLNTFWKGSPLCAFGGLRKNSWVTMSGEERKEASLTVWELFVQPQQASTGPHTNTGTTRPTPAPPAGDIEF